MTVMSRFEIVRLVSSDLIRYSAPVIIAGLSDRGNLTMEWPLTLVPEENCLNTFDMIYDDIRSIWTI